MNAAVGRFRPIQLIQQLVLPLWTMVKSGSADVRICGCRIRV